MLRHGPYPYGYRARPFSAFRPLLCGMSFAFGRFMRLSLSSRFCLLFVVPSCASAPPVPTAPAGAAYIYSEQGFAESTVSVTVPVGRYASVTPTFNSGGEAVASTNDDHRVADELPPSDGVHFNEHLTGQGVALTPLRSAASR